MITVIRVIEVIIESIELIDANRVNKELEAIYCKHI